MVNLTRPELSLQQQLNKLAQLLVASYDNKLATLPCTFTRIATLSNFPRGKWKLTLLYMGYRWNILWLWRGFHSWRLVTPCSRVACNYPRHSQLLFEELHTNAPRMAHSA